MCNLFPKRRNAIFEIEEENFMTVRKSKLISIGVIFILWIKLYPYQIRLDKSCPG